MTTTATPFLAQGNVQMQMPSAPTADNQQRALSLDSYGRIVQLAVAPTRHSLALQGAYLVAVNPTIGTGATWVAAQTAFADVNPNFLIFNSDPVRSLALDFVKLITTAVGTTAASWQFAVELDVGTRNPTTQHMSAATVNNPNMNKALLVTPSVQYQNSATATVIPAISGAGRVVSRGVLGGLNIAGDEMLVTFGTTDVGAYPGTADSANQPGRRVSCSAPVIIGPNQSATMYFWAPGSAASITPEFEIGMFVC